MSKNIKMKKSGDTDPIDQIIENIKSTDNGLFGGVVSMVSKNQDGKTDPVNTKKNKLEKSLDIIRTKKYDKTSVIYIDNDVHAALMRIKEYSSKINVGDMMSYIAENFLMDNKKELLDLIKSKQNKFLSE